MNRPTSSRLLSTSARVHPSYLPYLHNASRNGVKGVKWVPPLVGAITAGYAVATYREAQAETHLAQMQQAEVERRRKDAALADAYGDRSSLEELEKAMKVYEAQRGNE
ncbi:N-acetylglucosaminyl-phosphatidylinositol biosynthetic protein [Madurella mycetomatis]|uniref:N-acetylglucosaminyl-phosphatidylinositol biosynthetic protein n=1 Tax=Madurella mycetomatis TaxID=100816 RepID=A0A175W454_9PEZI|nr:N-acetylglucosaminyl-phosphatidylinositol biosynthetic protein [Madurella mycetomatis]